ncbi:secondary thiamine-phosphate synthase enzyme YjbQ [Marinovum sp.]|uniref:secondary thiamine-phosphate synthase enzyme YjbQ n=1 Tax=Marinovum sp. TaxID=2024839 RepID=UPI003A948354
MQTTFSIATHGPGLTEITREVAQWLTAAPSGPALLTLMIRHTSASLLIQENADPEVQTDLREFFHRLVPPSDHPAMAYLTHTYEGPDDMPAHIKAALLPVTLSIPVLDGTMRLGTWQGLYLFEHRTARKTREIIAHLA